MKNPDLDFDIYSANNFIEHIASGKKFTACILPLIKNDLQQVTKKKGWLFNWKTEFADQRKKVFKLVTIDHPSLIQGLVSLKFEPGYLIIELIENAPFNRSRTKEYAGVMGNLVAYACKLSFEKNNGGYVSFFAKTRLVEHYKKELGAVHEGGQLMVIYPDQAAKLVKQHFKTTF